MGNNIVSFSGGKDSSAMLLRMVELGYKIDKILFADTTLEFPEMYEWIDKIEKLVGIKVTRVTAKHSFDYWFYSHWTKGKHTDKIRGFPYVTRPCWWQRDAKDEPMKKHCKGNTVYVGIAKDEEKRKYRKRYTNGQSNFIFPLIEWGWSEDDCLKYLQSKGLKHPLTGTFKRSGCWLCPQQPKPSLKMLYKHYPNLWKKLKNYERDSPQGFKPNLTLDKIEKEVENETTD